MFFDHEISPLDAYPARYTRALFFPLTDFPIIEVLFWLKFIYLHLYTASLIFNRTSTDIENSSYLGLGKYIDSNNPTKSRSYEVTLQVQFKLSSVKGLVNANANTLCIDLS